MTAGRKVLWLLALVGMAIGRLPPAAAAPAVYSTPAYESPVRGDPDDLLLIPGYGLLATDKVVYQAISNTISLPTHPTTVPTTSSATLGVADVVNAADAPYSLVVRLPTAMTAGQSYVLWVASADQTWSSPILINDARPLWITPDTAYRTAQLASLTRELKVVGRNLQPAPGTSMVTQIRLVGATTGTTYTLTAKNTTNDPTNTTDAVQRSIAVVSLPATMVADQYNVQVSRDGMSWVALMGNKQSPAQTFTVKSDPVSPTQFSVSNPLYADPVTGICEPNDGIDDTGCILLAIRAAVAAGGGTVTLGPGVWTMSRPGTFPSGYPYSDRLQPAAQCTAPRDTCGVSWYGVLLPSNVNLQGAGASGSAPTEIEQTTGWTAAGSLTLFTMQGNNTVSGIYFKDDTNYKTVTATEPMLKLGANWWFAHMWGANDPVTVSNVVITNNLFDKPYRAIGNGGLPMDHVYITNNTFGGAYDTAVGIGSGQQDMQNLLPSQQVYPYTPFHYSDSIISHNTFYPSSQQKDPAAAAGVIATNIGSGLRTDFSNNVADGTATQYLYDPVNDPKGWRAAYFWSNRINVEMSLVSNNRATCTGDKNGDGEAFAYDGAGYVGGLPAAQWATGSTAWTDSQGLAGTAVTLQSTIATSFTVGNPATTLDISGDPSVYYRGFWAQVVQGKGKGQWRKIEQMSVGSNANGPTVTLRVTPAFDVAPDSTSRLVVQFAYWQNSTINNYVDQRSTICTKANARLGGRGGIMTWYAGTADSLMEGNQQYDTDGILLNHTYSQGTVADYVQVYTEPQSSNEIRGNLIQGDYKWGASYGHGGGIQLGFGAFVCTGTCQGPTAPDLGFDVTIAHNTINQADATDQLTGNWPPVGAIGLNSGWSTGAVDSAGLSMPQIGDATLIYHNSLQNISNTMPGSPPLPRVGIGIDVGRGSTAHAATSWHSTLYANSCATVDVPVSDFGVGTTRVCPTGTTTTCECSGVSSADVAVTATSIVGPTSDGGNVKYTVTVRNNSTTVTVTGVALTVEPSAGAQIVAGSYVSSTGSTSCDPNVNFCNLGSLAPGATATVTLDATLRPTDTWPVTFSVTHHEPDGVVTNDSTTVSAGVGLVGYWKFDEGSGTGTADSSGSGNVGTLANAPAWSTGKSGSALTFTAATSRVNVNDTGNLDNLYTTGMTLSAWIKPTGAGGGGAGRVVDKDNNDGGWFLKMNSASTLQFAGDQFGGTGSKAVSRNSTSSIVLNTWQHVAVTWDGSKSGSHIHFYVNGVSADDTSSSGTIDGVGTAGPDTTTPFVIGNRPGGDRNFGGGIDGVRVYNRILTLQEIQSLVSGGL